MKLSSFLLAAGIILMLYIVLPYVAFTINQTLGLPIFSGNPLSRWLGVLLVLFGIIFALIASITFKTLGNGAPVITEPPKKLVVKGLYRYTRNPIYLAHLIVLTGMFLFFGHTLLLVYAIAVAVGLHVYIVTIEEPELTKRYGENYIAYTQSVRRWI